MLRVIYGFIESALLWYGIFSTKLEGIGFEINPYDICVENKMIECSQCTISWYVYDNNLSHKTPEVILYIIKKVKKHSADLSVVVGNKHTLL